jgi:hypothetical protein
VTNDRFGVYPFFIQAGGSHVWAAHSGPLITADDSRLGIRLAREDFEQGLYGSGWDLATSTQRAFLVAMAEDHDDRSATSDLVSRLDHQCASDLSVNRSDLIRSGHINAPERGFVAFTVPGMDEHIRRRANL